MLIESLTLALAGDVAGLVVARLAMSAIVALGAGTIPRLDSLSLDPRLLAFSFVVATLSALVFGLAPALRVARTQPGDVLREQSRSSTGGATQMRLREWLVVSQVALAFVLLVGAGLLLASFERIRRVDLGVRPENVLTFELHLPDARYDSIARARFYDEFATDVARLPGVRAAGGVSRLPATGPFHSWGVRAVSGTLANTRAVLGAAACHCWRLLPSRRHSHHCGPRVQRARCRGNGERRGSDEVAHRRVVPRRRSAGGRRFALAAWIGDRRRDSGWARSRWTTRGGRRRSCIIGIGT